MCPQRKTDHYISEVDVEEDYRLPTDDDVEGDNYSIVTNLNEKINTPEVYSDPPDVAEETDIKQIYEGGPNEDKPFYEELFDMFNSYSRQITQKLELSGIEGLQYH